MSKIYSIISGKGGVGKTTSAINIAASMNALGEDVILVDTNLSTPNIGLHLGAPIVPITLNHLLNGKADLEDAIYEHHSGMKIIPASLSIEELRKINHDKINYVAEQLRHISKHILFDSSAGLGKESESSMNASDEIIIITNPEMPAVTDALKTAKLAEKLKKNLRGFIVTRYQGRKTEMPIDNIKDMLEIPLLGVIPEDKNMQKALAMKDAILHTHPKSQASKAYRKVTERILGNRYTLKLEQEDKSFWNRLMKGMGVR